MSQTYAIDVSKYNNTPYRTHDIDWGQVPQSIVLIKMSGGDDGLYTDPKANYDYYGAKSAGKAIGMYHFAGGKDAVNEADFFVAACSPLDENDVLVLDWELDGHPDPVNWCVAFIQRVIDRTGVRPMFYTNSSRLFADRNPSGTIRYLDWSPVANLNVGLWVAHYSIPPSGNVPIKSWPTYVMHQYSDNGTVAGIDGPVDLDMWFGTVEQFKAYGFHSSGNIPTPTPSPVVAPNPEPTTPPTPTPTPEPTPPPVEAPNPQPQPGDSGQPSPAPAPTPEPTTVPTDAGSTSGLKKALLAVGATVAALLAWFLAWIHH